MKDPIIAALLNFFFSGAGYLYLGRRKLFGLLLLGSFLVSLLSAGVSLWVLGGNEVTGVGHLMTAGFLFIATLLMGGAFAYDAFADTKTHNYRAAHKKAARSVK